MVRKNIYIIEKPLTEQAINLSCCDPSSKLNRFIALILICLLGFGPCLCYDNPAALQDHFQNELNMTTTEFSVLYSVCLWPNVVLCFIGGFLLDRLFGIRLGTMIYLLIILIGQFLFACGSFIDTYSVMVIGRFILGIGTESLNVAQNKYTALWFKGKELSMVFGFLITFSRLAATINFVVMEPIYNYFMQFYQAHTAIGLVLVCASVGCFISLLSAFILGWMEQRTEKFLPGNEDSKETIRFSDIFTFKLSFWMVAIICVCYYTAIFPFTSLGKVFFIEKWNLTPQQANTLNSCITVIGIVACPIIGFIVDNIGNNINFVLFAICTTIIAHSLLAFTMLNPYIGVIVIGISFSIFATCLWPLIVIIIPSHQLGTAYGIAMSIHNLGMAIISLVAGVIVDKFGYLYLEIFFIGWLLIALSLTIFFWFYDKNTQGNSNMRRKQNKNI